MTPMDDSDSLEQQADRAAAAGDFARARESLEQAVARDGANPALWAKLSAMRKASGDAQGALDALDRALAINPLDFSFLLSRALILERLGDPQAAIEFGNALAQAPADEEVPPPMRPTLNVVLGSLATWKSEIAAIARPRA